MEEGRNGIENEGEGADNAPKGRHEGGEGVGAGEGVGDDGRVGF
jgi:hypothetical protein